MGLNAVVYLSRLSLPRDVEALGAKKDSLTGEYYFEETAAAHQLPPRFSDAVHKRLGNISAIAELREDVREIFGTTATLLHTKCLYSRTHSGDVIEIELLDQIELEIAEARKSGVDRPLLRQFLDAMTELVRIARRENNPIVFV
jgi:hypothetical protein